ncbi:MAG TPA: polyprenyl synthetase family protein [Pirellulaceae bacterium]|nr:polyprenyl synthetase family protein [Pirellulaceae bacterium]HMO92765.1 polyprenyl synthetase family protein [Pirellulaceae bacterium]HMP69347.1 polyprenyl synthetase family protein [Pirellulaceae bacterium]
MNNIGTELARSYRTILEIIQPELEQVEELLRQELSSDNDFVQKMLQHPMFWGGKRIRPALVLLSGRALQPGNLTPNHHVVAAVLEMIHAATLVHDDILDEAMVRRNCESLNQQWGSQLSVLLGDFLFSHAFTLASTTGSTFACQQIGLATNAVCAGEINQITSQGNFELTESDYLHIIDGKTGRLCSVACLLGAHFSDAPAETATILESIGLYYGRAFQIIDDVLDIRGNEAKVGKSLGSDYRQGKLTLPLISALQTSGAALRDEIVARMRKGEFKPEEVSSFIDQHGGFDYAFSRATEYVHQAQALLQEVSPNCAQPMMDLGDFILTRQS